MNKSRRVLIVSFHIFTIDELSAGAEISHQGNLLLPDEDNRFIANFVFITHHYIGARWKKLSRNDALTSTIEFGHKINVRQIEIVFITR